MLGDNTTVTKSSPVFIASGNWTSVSAGGTHSAAIRSDGVLFAWGLGASGQLGTGNTGAGLNPTQVGSSSWTMVSAGGTHTAAIRSDKILFAWGYGAAGRLGDNTIISKSSPVQIGGGLTPTSVSPIQIGSSSWTAVSAGNFHNVAIRSDSQLFAWGSNAYNRLGDGTVFSKASPVQIGSLSISWVMIDAGDQHTLGR